MAYELGTATNYLDLLNRLVDFLSNPNRDNSTGDPSIDELVAIDDGIGSGEASQAWTVLKYDKNYDAAGGYEVYLRGPGMSGEDEIYVGINTVKSAGDDYYNWRLFGMTGWVDGVDTEYQPGITQGRLPRMLLWNQPIKYWFVANGRRFIVVAKISSVYECCYMGFALPYGLPTQFPYPLVVGGSACPYTTGSYNRYSSTQNDHRSFMNPYGYAAGAIVTGTFDANAYQSTLKVLQGTSWIEIQNKSSSTLYYTNCVWPYCNSENQTYQINYFSNKLRENIDGSYPIFSTIICMSSPSKSIMGELQGVFATTGFGGLAAEDIFTVDGKTYVAFPCVYNADRSDWFALKLE